MAFCTQLFLIVDPSIDSPPAAPKVKPRRKVDKNAEVQREPSSDRTPIIVDEEEDKPKQKNQDAFMSNMSILFQEEAELYLWDMDAGDFRNDGVVVARITEQTDANFTYWLTASNENGLILAHRICSDMNQRFSTKMLSLTWNHLGDNGSQSSWLFRFATEQDFAQLKQVFTQTLWQSLHETLWGKAKVCLLIYFLNNVSSDPFSRLKSKIML